MPNLRAAALLFALLLAAGPARAADPPPEAYDGGLLDGYSRLLFAFDRAVYGGLAWIGHAVSGKPPPAAPATDPAPPDGRPPNGPPAAPSALASGIGNVASNLVNEPVTAVTALALGEFGVAWHAGQRFAINSTLGVLGWQDAASAMGLPRQHLDAGLLLCQAGVPEGGYVVLPFIGPRTVRDGVADIVISNAILWTAVGLTLGTGASLQTIVIAEAIEIVADIIATRQMDSVAVELSFDDYEAMRAAYLEQRRRRCDDLRRAAGKPSPAP
ncbi:MAG: hypothetical protein OHK0024_12800 [Thalassobaculales bacterium]